MRILYFHCFSGISGDMTLASLIDLGADLDYVEKELKKLQIEPFSLQWKKVNKCGISSLKVDVVPDPQHPPQHHRHYSEIVQLIKKAGYNERVTALSLAIFEKIGKAEAKIHNVALDHVHFHEVGAIDSIVDIVGTALAIDSLDVEQIYSSPVPLGFGTVLCDHGTYPVPAPATLEIMKGLPIAATTYAMELTTPTGAGIIAGIVDRISEGLPPMIVESVGYGAGTRDMANQPNVLRTMVGRMDSHIHVWHPGGLEHTYSGHLHHHHHEQHDHPDHHHDNDNQGHHDHDRRDLHAHHHNQHDRDEHEHDHHHDKHNHKEDAEHPSHTHHTHSKSDAHDDACNHDDTGHSNTNRH